jgi:hypothetical protein
LVVHCYPRKSGKWRRTLAHLTAGDRWAQFTGRKIVSVAHDECCDDPDDVCNVWPAECEFIVRPNDRPLQEVANFLPMLERVASIDRDEFTTYVHCKGATQPDGHASHLWCDGMAAANLDYPRLLECCFANGANIAGAFRSHGLWNFPGYHNWHYAGTWFTFRHSRIFGQLDWRNIHQNFMGVEAWPGIVPAAESACLFFDNADTAHLYSNEFWRDIITPSLAWWHRSLQQCGLTPAGR